MSKIAPLFWVAVLLAVGLTPLSTVLEIRDARQGKTVFIQRVSPGDTFSIRFVHSVERSPVTDYFRIDGADRMVLYETAFRSLNTGLPATLSEGQRLSRTDQGFRLSIPDRVLPEIRLWVDRRYDGTLTLGDRDIPLAGLSGNTLLQVRVRDAALWEYASPSPTDSTKNRLESNPF